MKFKRIQLRNYRCFRNLDMKFSIDNDKPITLIKGSYGSGKTVFIDSFYWILTDSNIYSTYYKYPEILNNDIYTQLMERKISDAEVYGELEFEFSNDEYRIERKDVYSLDSQSASKLCKYSKRVLFKRCKDDCWSIIAIDDNVLSILSDMMPMYLLLGILQVRSCYYDGLNNGNLNRRCDQFNRYLDELRKSGILYVPDHSYRKQARKIKHLMEAIRKKESLSDSLIGCSENSLSKNSSNLKISLFEDNEQYQVLSWKLKFCERCIENIISYNKNQETSVLEYFNILLNESYSLFDKKKDDGIRSIIGVYNNSCRGKFISYDSKNLCKIIKQLQSTGDFDNRISLNMEKGYDQNEAYNKVFEDIIINSVEPISMRHVDIHVLTLIKAIYDFSVSIENFSLDSCNSYPLVIDYSWLTSDDDLFAKEYFSEMRIPKQVIAINHADHSIREDLIGYIGKSYYLERNEKETIISPIN